MMLASAESSNCPVSLSDCPVSLSDTSTSGTESPSQELRWQLAMNLAGGVDELECHRALAPRPGAQVTAPYLRRVFHGDRANRRLAMERDARHGSRIGGEARGCGLP